MKKFGLVSLMLAILLVFCACGGSQEEEMPTGPITDESEGDHDYSLPKIGFSLAGSGPFYDQLKADIEQACERLEYQANLVFADTGEKQQRDIRSMLSVGVEAIVIDPVDVDVLESVLAECESEEVPVINIVDSINGRVDTLISPDYLSVGKKAAQQAAALFPDGGGLGLELKSDYDSFIMQLISDGFVETASANESITLAAESYCGSDEEQAYMAAKDAIAQKNVNFIFAHKAALAKGAMRAIEEAGSEIHLVVFGGDMELIKAVEAGKINAAIFFGTQQLVDIAVGMADEFVKSDTFEPQLYIELSTDIVTAENVSEYVSDSLQYAQVKTDVESN